MALGDTFLTDTPTQAPRSLERKAALRWLRAIQDHPAPRDRVLALLPFYAGLRIAEAVGLDVDDVHLSARKGTLRVQGKGGTLRELPIHPQLRTDLQGVQPRYGQKPPSVDHGVSFRCSGGYGLSVLGFDRSLNHESRHLIRAAETHSMIH